MKPLSEVAPGLLVIQIPIQAVWEETLFNGLYSLSSNEPDDNTL